MLPPMSSVPAVDSDFDFACASTFDMFASCCADWDVSCDAVPMTSPDVAEIIAPTSAAVLSIMLMFRSLKSCIWFAVSDNSFSRDLIWLSRDEHAHLR